MSVSFEGLASFWKEKRGVCFELRKRIRGCSRYREVFCLFITLKETMYPPGFHSSTKALRNLGT